MINFTVLENGKLRLTLSSDGNKDEVIEIVERQAAIHALVELTEHYWKNGWGILGADDLSQMSSAPVIAEGHAVEGDGSNTLWGKAWYYPNYAIYNPLKKMLENDHVDFDFWGDFGEGENFLSLY